MKRGARRQFALYGAVGVAATTAHYLLLVLGVEQFGWPAWLASGAGAVLGAQVAYLGNRRFTFLSNATVLVSWPRFQAVALAGAVLGMSVVAVAVAWGLHYVLAQCLATGLGFALTFAINRAWTFR